MFVDFNILNQLGSPSINSNTFANRPSAGQVGRLFVSTDTFEIYRDNGTGWDLIGGPGSSTITGSGTANTFTIFTGTNSIGDSSYLTQSVNAINVSNAEINLPSNNVISGTNYGIKQIMATNDYWRIYGNTISSDVSEMVLELGDNAEPISINGQRYRFFHNNTWSGTAKDVLIVDYENSTFNTNIIVNSPNSIGVRTATPGAALDVHSTADVGFQLNGTGATPSILQAFLSAGVSQYQIGYNWNSDINYRRFSIYDVQGLKEVISIDQQSRFVGINYQYSSLADQPAYTLDVSGSGRFTDNGYFATNGTSRVIIGNGTDDTINLLQTYTNLDSANWIQNYATNNAEIGGLATYRSRGTIASKIAVNQNDNLGNYVGRGYNGTQFAGGAGIEIYANEIYTSTNAGGYLTVYTTSNGTLNSVGRHRFDAAGGFHIGANSDVTSNFICQVTGDTYLNGKIAVGVTSFSTGTIIEGVGGRIRMRNDSSLVYSASNSGTFNVVGQWRNLTSGTGYNSCITLTSEPNGEWYILSVNLANNSDLVFNGRGSSGYFEAMRLTASQNCLIGTSVDAGKKLQVNGTALINNTATIGGTSVLGIDVNGSGGIANPAILATISSNDGNALIYRRTFGANTASAGLLGQLYNSNNSFNTYTAIYSQIIDNTAGSEDGRLFVTCDKNGTETIELTIDSSGLKTSTPVGGTAAYWKFGQRVAAAVVLDATQYIELEVGGTLYKLAIVT